MLGSSESENDTTLEELMRPGQTGRLNQVETMREQQTKIKLDREWESIVDSKIEDWKREKLEREFKCLFYKTREIKELLQDFSDFNEQLQQEARQKEENYKNFVRKHKDIKRINASLVNETNELNHQIQSLQS